jgi:uncharacterized protein (DUF58 family)
MLAICVIGAIGGRLLGWTEWTVAATAAAGSLVIAVGFVIGRRRLHVTRTLSSERVTVGERATSVLEITNPTGRPVGACVVEEQLGPTVRSIDIDGLQPGATTTVEVEIPTDRRGIVDVGPAVIAATDPLGLLCRRVPQTGRETLRIHPRHITINPLPIGLAKDLDGPTSDRSPAGDIAFHALRD